VQTFETKKIIAKYDTNAENLRERLGSLHKKNSDLENKIGELELLVELNSFASQRLNRDETLIAIQKLFVNTFGLDKYMLLLKTDTKDQLELTSCFGLKRNHEQINVDEKKKLFQTVLLKGESVYIADANENENTELFLTKKAGGAILALPLISLHESIIGIMTLYRKSKESFSQLEIDFFQLLATHAAGVIDKSILFHTTQELAYTDALTGIFNRRYFDQRFSREILRARRYSRSLSILMIDIDFFKKYNDTFGHLMGDQALRKVASVLEDKLRRADILCRYGGEEFVVILPEINLKNATIVAEKLRKAIINKMKYDDHQSKTITISVGVASFPENSTDEEIILGMADQALYQAKESGRNKVCVFAKKSQ
jgi:diguanylate cyclase (GGDEF)-like protein